EGRLAKPGTVEGTATELPAAGLGVRSLSSRLVGLTPLAVTVGVGVGTGRLGRSTAEACQAVRATLAVTAATATTGLTAKLNFPPGASPALILPSCWNIYLDLPLG